MNAAGTLVREKGLANVALRDIAEGAGLTSAAILYYYPNIDHLFAEVYELATERFVVGREQAVAELGDPVDKLAIAIRLGMPTDPHDDLVRLLYEFEGLALHDERCAQIACCHYERQVDMYIGILELGVSAGAFRLSFPADAIARMLVGIEDGIGYYVALGHMAADQVTAIAFEQAASATGASVAHLKASVARVLKKPESSSPKRSGPAD